MAAWFSENIGNAVVILIVIAVIVLGIRSIIKDRRSGKGGCGCGCASCAMKGSCHSHKK